MKRIVIGLATVAAFAIGGMFASKAEAHYPHHHHHPHYCGPRVSVGYGGYVPYGGYGVYRPAVVVPYGAGYVGGWQPYSGGFYVQQPRFGLSFGY